MKFNNEKKLENNWSCNLNENTLSQVVRIDILVFKKEQGFQFGLKRLHLVSQMLPRNIMRRWRTSKLELGQPIGLNRRFTQHFDDCLLKLSCFNWRKQADQRRFVESLNIRKSAHIPWGRGKEWHIFLLKVVHGSMLMGSSENDHCKSVI